ncbi:MAG TPA: hypothetical protein VHV49_04350 [Pseudonocardiaceae bacterium]|jgi:hypothetical protein|nr:hypothetical protein [Pseudonocardiaceae bacterium]
MNPKTAVMAAVAASLLGFVAGCAHRAVPATQPALGVGTVSAARPATCPASLASHYTYPPASRVSIVPGTPDRAIVCRYAGLNDPDPHTLVKSATMGAAQAAALARTLDLGKPFPVGVAYNCGNDVGLIDLVRFGFPDGHGVDVQLDMTGCRTAANGEREVFYPAAAVGQVTALVGR